MTIEDKLDHLVQTKEWEHLTAEEKMLLRDHAITEDQFRSLKKLDDVLTRSSVDSVTPSAQTLPSLKKILKNKHSSESIFTKLMHVRFPAYASVFFILLGCAVGWFISSQRKTETKIVEVPVINRDTVYLTATADTIYVDRVVVRYVTKQVMQHAPVTIAEQSSQNNTVSVGVSMKEKSELDNLLVSGSE